MSPKGAASDATTPAVQFRCLEDNSPAGSNKRTNEKIPLGCSIPGFAENQSKRLRQQSKVPGLGYCVGYKHRKKGWTV